MKSPYLQIANEIAHLRELQRGTESQYRILTVASVLASAVAGSLVGWESSLLILVLPTVSALLLGIWAYSEAQFRETENRAVGLLLNLDRYGVDQDEEGSRILDEDIAAYLDSWFRTRSKVTRIERTGYGIVTLTVIVAMLAKLIRFPGLFE